MLLSYLHPPLEHIEGPLFRSPGYAYSKISYILSHTGFLAQLHFYLGSKQLSSRGSQTVDIHTVYLPSAFHDFQAMFVLQVPVQLPLGAVDKLTLRTLHSP